MSQRPDPHRSGYFTEWQPEDFGPADEPQAGWEPAEHVHDQDAGFATWRQADHAEPSETQPAWQAADPEAEPRPPQRNLPALRTAENRPPTPRPVAPQQALVPWTDPDAPVAMAPPPYLGQPLYPPPVQTDPRKAAQHGLEMIRRHKGLILLTFLAFFAGVVAYTFTATPRYEAYSLLLLDTQQQDQNDPLAVPSENASVASRMKRPPGYNGHRNGMRHVMCGAMRRMRPASSDDTRVVGTSYSR